MTDTETVKKVAEAIREHIRVDATGLAPAVVGHFIFGFDAAARAAIAAMQGWRPIEEAPHNVNVLLAWRDWTLPGTWNMEAGMASWGWSNEIASTRCRHGEAKYFMPLPLPPEKE